MRRHGWVATVVASAALALGIVATPEVAYRTPAAPRPQTRAALAAPIVGVAADPSGQGYWEVGADGGIFNFGGAPFDGNTYTLGLTGLGGSRPLAAPIVGMAATPDGKGYWLVAADGGVFSFGDAGFYGNTYTLGLTGLGGSRPLAAPIVGIVPTPDGKGYWLVAKDGGVFSFGDAGFYGNTYTLGLTGLGGSRPLAAPVVGMATTPDGKGYWLVAADGGVFSFGDAGFYGNTYTLGLTGLGGSRPLAAPVVGIDPSPTGAGYTLVAADGGVFTFGDASFDGTTYSMGYTGLGGSHPLPGAIVGAAEAPGDTGYWMTSASGSIFAFGSAPFDGDTSTIGLTPTVQNALANPSTNLAPTFDAACFEQFLASGTVGSTACDQDAIAAIDQAHSDEGLPPLSLPSNFYALTNAEQLFVLVNEERIQRGLPALYGLAGTLNADATAGAQSNSDPGFAFTQSWPWLPDAGSNWAGDYAPAASMFDWMYNDGWGGSQAATSNIDCTSATAPGCWGHRANILITVPQGAVGVMGAASIPESTLGASGSPFESDTMVVGFVPAASVSGLTYTYTWSEAVQAGADPQP